MCGIVGVVAKCGQRPSVSPEQLVAMRDTMTARGPDGCGLFSRENVAFGHRRLAIRDLSGGEQPWVSADDRCVLVYNGELYNDDELRRELASLGHRFRTRCDTETLMAAWQQWGADALPRLAGMFAFAVYDFSRNRLTLVRDRFGIKPLFLTSPGGELAFASSAAALLRHPRVSREPNWRAVNHYLTTFRITLGRETMLRDVQQLRPAEQLTWDLHTDQVVIERYWRFPCRSPAPDHAAFKRTAPRGAGAGEAGTVGVRMAGAGTAPAEPSFQAAADQLDERLTAATVQHLASDVPVGMFLSGGVDSNTLASIVAEHQQAGMLGVCGGGASETGSDGTADAAQSEQTIAISETSPSASASRPANAGTTAAATDREPDDFDFAAACARHAGFDFDEVRVTADECFESWGELLTAGGLPLPTPSDGIIHRLAQRMKQSVGVVLGGEGADELLCGYARPHWSIEDYRLSHLAETGHWPGTAAQHRVFLQSLHETYGRSRFSGPVDHYFAANSLIPAEARQTLLSPDVWAAADGDEPVTAFYAAEFAEAASCADASGCDGAPQTSSTAVAGHSSTLLARQAVLLHRLNLESLLGRLDTATMAASLEARVPYADHRLVEFAFQLPLTFSIDVDPGAETHLLPAAELDRRGNLRSKRLLREIAQRRLPGDLAWRPKASFPTPVARWLAGPWQHWASSTLRHSSFARNVFSRSALGELAGNVPAAGLWLWPILNLIRWGEEVL